MSKNAQLKLEHPRNGAEVKLSIDGRTELEGDLVVPSRAAGVVLFAHGSGSSRHSPRNRQVADYLEGLGLGTLLIDLLTQEEELAERRTRHLRFDIGLLAGRLTAATEWLNLEPSTRERPIGYFGASTGAAAALVAAAPRDDIAAVVSRGGRPDLAGPALPGVAAPTLLLVGGRDRFVLELNREAYDRLTCEKALEVIPGATHLFEEPGALEQVAETAGQWFIRWMEGSTPP